jgi:glycine oxidase
MTSQTTERIYHHRLAILTTMTDTVDVLILGGGVIGLTTAWFAAEAGARVTVVDQGDMGHQASWAGAGILAPGDVRHAHSAYEQLHARSVALYPDLSRKLFEQTGIDNGYRVCGGLELFLQASDESSEEWRAEEVDCREYQREELHRFYPYLAPAVERAFFLPDMAQVRNPRHMKALQAACAASGVTLRPHCPVRRLIRAGSCIDAVETTEGQLRAVRFLIAAGAWSEALLQPLGFRAGIKPIRGQIALLNHEASAAWPILLRGKRYLVPRGDGRLVVGSTEEDAGFTPRTTASAIADLLTFAASLIPELAHAEVERCWAGLRPGSPDGKPFLGVVPGVHNLFVAAGHFRAGLQLSPATALVMKELLLDEKPTMALDDFRLDRPTTPPVQAAFRS